MSTSPVPLPANLRLSSQCTVSRRTEKHRRGSSLQTPKRSRRGDGQGAAQGTSLSINEGPKIIFGDTEAGKWRHYDGQHEPCAGSANSFEQSG